MHKLYELKDKLMHELEAYADNGKYSKEDVEAIKYMASAVDHLCNIMEGSDEYSNRSYAQRRDARGRYSRENMRNRSYGYSMAGNMAEELKELMQDAPDSQTRQEIQRIVDRLSRM